MRTNPHLPYQRVGHIKGRSRALFNRAADIDNQPHRRRQDKRLEGIGGMREMQGDDALSALNRKPHFVQPQRSSLGPHLGCSSYPYTNEQQYAEPDFDHSDSSRGLIRERYLRAGNRSLFRPF